MRFCILLIILVLNIGFALPSAAQVAGDSARPVSRREVRRGLTITQDDPVLSEDANRELIAEIQKRGVNFVLSAAEEWSFQLLEASDDLIEAIRDAIPADQRNAILKASEQTRLYKAFESNYSRNDINSRRTAVDAGKEFVRLYRSDTSVAKQIQFINRRLPQLERTVNLMQRGVRTRRGKN